MKKIITIKEINKFRNENKVLTTTSIEGSVKKFWIYVELYILDVCNKDASGPIYILLIVSIFEKSLFCIVFFWEKIEF